MDRETYEAWIEYTSPSLNDDPEFAAGYEEWLSECERNEMDADRECVQ